MAVGGAQRVLLDQADWFHAHGHRVVAAFFYDRDGLQQEWQSRCSYPLYNLEAFKPGVGNLRQMVHFLQSLRRLWRLLRTEHFDIIETFTLHSNMPGMILSWLADIPVRMATHHGKVGNVSRWQERLHLLIIGRIASVIIAVSTEVRDHVALSGIDPRKIIVIPNGIKPSTPNLKEQAELRREFGLYKDQIVLISVGRLVYQKAHSVLINAVQEILVQRPEVMLYIAGEGPLRRELEQQIGAFGLSDQICLLGNRNDVPGLLSIADIFVLPSRWEGLPMALLEAMGIGLPIVATQVEGVNGVLQQNIQGFLVPSEDDRALAEALLKLIKNPQLRIKMGLKSRKRVGEAYTTDIMCEKYLTVMMDYLRLKSPRENK
jgi:glycosyltransferase involved in cell wall biosynthesis